MKAKKFVAVVVVLLFPLLLSAQSALEQYVSDANSRCPLTYSDGWSVEAFSCVCDTVTADIKLSGEAAGYLPMLASNAEAVKGMWLGQMSLYGEQWNRLVRLVVAEGKTLAVVLRNDDKTLVVRMVFTPDELKQNLKQN